LVHEQNQEGQNFNLAHTCCHYSFFELTAFFTHFEKNGPNELAYQKCSRNVGAIGFVANAEGTNDGSEMNVFLQKKH
jgi:hypothetical protein